LRNLNDDQRALVWLSAAEITSQRVHRLSEEYGSPAAVREAFTSENGPVFHESSGKVLKKLFAKDALDELLERLEKSQVHLLFESDDDYPVMLRTIDDFPYLLYYAGRLECLAAPMVALVGTRKASSYGLGMAKSIARDLAAEGVTVVSGLARGIDSAAHAGALEAGGCTLGVLGCGINNPYPPENTPLLRRIAGGKGLIISEYPLDADPRPFHFPYRNRIISGLSQATVFVEGAIKSGGMHTVNSALVQGREVFAVPGMVGTKGSEGPHAILREGARIVTSARDVLEDLGLMQDEKRRKAATVKITDPMQRRILKCLRLEPMTVEQLAENLQTDTSDVLVQLTMMEISGFITREPGNLFLASR